MADGVATIKEWQELIGAIIGALAALGVALLVAYSGRRRDDLSAAMVVVGNLTTLMVAEDTIRRIAGEQKVAAKDYPMFVVSRLTHSRLKLSPLFESSVARLMLVDVSLAAHLELLNVIYRSVEHHVDVIRRDIDHHNEHGKFLRSEKDVIADAELVEKGLTMAAKHAACAERLLSLLVLNKWRLFHRARMAIRARKEECACQAFLRTGAL
jgi:hypothetical protein